MYEKSITKEALQDLPLLKFEGEIVVIENSADLKKAIEECEKYSIVGFDTETKPTFKKGEYNPVALVQLSLENTAYLIRINKTGITHDLIRLFENPNIEKLGIGLRDDIKDLQKMKSFAAAGFVDLNECAESLEMESIGARKLSGIFLKSRISKNQQVSNWENPKLTPSQMTYAATDAWICLEIYEKMQELL